jgi:hypothetical protein
MTTLGVSDTQPNGTDYGVEDTASSYLRCANTRWGCPFMIMCPPGETEDGRRLVAAHEISCAFRWPPNQFD